MNEVMEVVCHGMLEGGSNIFEAKGHDWICECTTWGCECRLIMVFFPELNLVISRKSVHEGKGLISSARIHDLVDERCGEVVFGTCPIEIMEVCANMNSTLFFIHGNRIRNPSGLRNGVDEAGSAQLLYLSFNCSHFGRVNGPLLLAYGSHIGPCVDVVFHDGWI